MLSLQGIIEFLKERERLGKNFAVQTHIKRHRDVYYDMSLHIDGACPRYSGLSKTERGEIYPTNYFGEEYQWRFDNRLLSRHPRESDGTRNWRLSQYRPFTQQPFLQVIQIILGAIFQDSGYSIDIENKDDSAYIWGNNFDGKSLVGYISDKFQNMCTDPNGVFVVIPKTSAKKTNTEKVEPEIIWIPSKFIWYKTSEEIIFSLDEIFWCVNPYGYFRFQKKDDEFVNIDGKNGSYYSHYLLRLPHHTAGGIWNTQGFFESWLHAAKSWADEFVSSKSAEQLVNKEASHPIIIEASTDCDECAGVGQYICCEKCRNPQTNCNCETYTPAQYSCNKCSGTGEMSRNPGDRMIAPAKDMGTELVQIINPDVKINELHAKNNADLLNSILRALYLNYIEVAQSGVAKDKDLQARHQFILTISNDLFDRLISGIINDILSLRNVSVNNGAVTPYAGEYEIVKPTQFQIKTSFDLLEEYKMATDSKIPDFMLAKQLEDYADKQFGGDEVLKKKTWFINQRNPLALKDSANVLIMVSNGAATQRDWQFSMLLPNMIDRLIREKSSEWFKYAEYDKIDEAISVYFEQIPIPVEKKVADKKIS